MGGGKSRSSPPPPPEAPTKPPAQADAKRQVAGRAAASDPTRSRTAANIKNEGGGAGDPTPTVRRTTRGLTQGDPARKVKGTQGKTPSPVKRRTSKSLTSGTGLATEQIPRALKSLTGM